jgi:hypothetical protein
VPHAPVKWFEHVVAARTVKSVNHPRARGVPQFRGFTLFARHLVKRMPALESIPDLIHRRYYSRHEPPADIVMAEDILIAFVPSNPTGRECWQYYDFVGDQR